MYDHAIGERTVLITGGAGFVGSHIADALVGDNAVRVLDDLSDGRRSNVPAGATLIEGDVREEETIAEAMAGVDLCFHEAGMVSVDRSIEAPEECHAVNASATVSLLEAARRADARLVFASSVAIYGQPTSIPIAESDRKEPTSPYGIDKLVSDHYVRAYADLYDLPTVSLRYFNIYGPRQSAGDYGGVISIFLDRAQRGEPLVIDGDGSQTRDFVHVSDVVDANLRAATTDATGEGFNIGTGSSVSIRELAELVVEVTGSDSEITHGKARPGDIERSRADLTRIRENLGYEPATDLEAGLAALANGSE
jgi:UDP-glucose 4-epimerase